jgi:hypothetical protein
MAELQIDPFVSIEPEVEVDDETLQMLDERDADPAPLIPADEAHEQISNWLSDCRKHKQI